jgi:hypothetical protein
MKYTIIIEYTQYEDPSYVLFEYSLHFDFPHHFPQIAAAVSPIPKNIAPETLYNAQFGGKTPPPIKIKVDIKGKDTPISKYI